jgi:uncharacterized protein (DUF924 family)
MNQPTALATAAEVVAFWRDAGHERWFRKDDAFDASFRDRFLPTHEAAARGELDAWLASAEGALALVILLDQFPRNAFRGTPRVYATDGKAREAADAAIRLGFDLACAPELRSFFYMPFMHSEALPDLDRCVRLMEPLGGESARYAAHHRAIVERFGRFPHRNAILGRETTAEEQRYIDEGGFSG